MNLLIRLIFVLAFLSSTTTVTAHSDSHHKYKPKPKITISVLNISDGGEIRNRQTLTAETFFQVKVTTNGVDCAGQHVVTAIGAPGFPPSVLVQASTFTVGPAVSSDFFINPEILTSTIQNHWQISASCNGVRGKRAAFDFFEFFVDAQ